MFSSLGRAFVKNSIPFYSDPVWCNGNTTDFDSVVLGSSPGTGAKTDPRFLRLCGEQSKTNFTAVTQWTRVLRYERGSRRFESFRRCQALVVKWYNTVLVRQNHKFNSCLEHQTIASADGAVPGLLNQVMGVRISPEAPDVLCPCGQIGKGSSLKRSVSVSRFESGQGYQIREVWQSLVYCTGLENRRSETVREFESHRFHQLPV